MLFRLPTCYFAQSKSRNNIHNLLHEHPLRFSMVDYYQETESEAEDDIVCNGNGSEFNDTKVAGKGLCNNTHGVASQTADDGGTHNSP